MALALIRLRLGIALTSMRKQWWRGILMAVLLVYLGMLLAGLSLGAYAIGSLGLPALAVVYAGVLSLFVLIIALTITYFLGGSALNPAHFSCYVAPTVEFSRALRRASVVGALPLSLLCVNLTTLFSLLGVKGYSHDYYAGEETLWQAVHSNVAPCPVPLSLPLWLLIVLCVLGAICGTYLLQALLNAFDARFNSELLTSKRTKRQLLQGVSIMAAICLFYLVMYLVKSHFDAASLPAVVQELSAPWTRVLWYLFALSPLGMFIFAPLLAAGAYVPAGVALVSSVAWAAWLDRSWPHLVARVMSGAGEKTRRGEAKSALPQGRETERETVGGGGKLAGEQQVEAEKPPAAAASAVVAWRLPTFWRFVGLSTPGQMQYARLLRYMFKNPVQVMATAVPVYIAVIFFFVQLMNNHLPAGNLNGVLGIVFITVVVSALTPMNMWSWDSSAYWYQIIAALDPRQDRLARMLVFLTLQVPVLLVITLGISWFVALPLGYTLYALAWVVLLDVICIGVQMLWSACVSLPGPGPKDGIKNNAANNGMLRIFGLSLAGSLLTLFFGGLYGGAILLIYNFWPGYLWVTLPVGIILAGLAVGVGIFGGAKALQTLELKNFARVCSWTGHTYNL